MENKDKTRKVLSLKEKANIIKRLEEGARSSMLADELKLPRSINCVHNLEPTPQDQECNERTLLLFVR